MEFLNLLCYIRDKNEMMRRMREKEMQKYK